MVQPLREAHLFYCLFLTFPYLIWVGAEEGQQTLKAHWIQKRQYYLSPIFFFFLMEIVHFIQKNLQKYPT